MNSFKHSLRFNRVTVALVAACLAFGHWLKREAQIIALHTLLVGHNLFRAAGLGGLAPMRMHIDAPAADAFETEVLAGVKSLRGQQELMLKSIDRLDKETKTALEELTKVKNAANSIGEFETKLAKVNQLLKQQARSSFGSPIQRIQHDDEMRIRLNLAVRGACNIDKLLDGSIAKLRDEIKGKALDVTNTPGTTLFTNELLREIYDLLSSYGAWSTLGVRRMGTKLTKLPIKTARPIAYVIKPGNRQFADDANKAGTTADLEAELIGVLITVYNELLQDSEFDVTSDVLDDFMEAVAYRMDFCAFRADGTDDATNGAFTGLFEFAPSVTADATRTTIGATKFTDWLKCLNGVDPVVLTRAARWWIHPTNIARAVGVVDGNGRPIFQTALEVPNPGSIMNLLGYPITPLLVGPSTDAASQDVAAFGDPNGYVVGVRQDFEFAASDDFKFDYYSRAFRGVARAGFKGRRTGAFRVLTLPAS